MTLSTWLNQPWIVRAVLLGAILALMLLAIPRGLSAGEISWQEAVSRLAGERTRAETCASLLKQHGDAAAVSRGQLMYANAKGDIDAVIAGLIVTLAEGDDPPSLPDLEATLTAGVDKREALCAEAVAVTPQDDGTKSVVTDLLGDVIGSLIDAVVEIYKVESEADMLRRKTIQTQLEGAKWADFADIQA